MFVVGDVRELWSPEEQTSCTKPATALPLLGLAVPVCRAIHGVLRAVFLLLFLCPVCHSLSCLPCLPLFTSCWWLRLRVLMVLCLVGLLQTMDYGMRCFF